jgi:hypothetical protein
VLAALGVAVLLALALAWELARPASARALARVRALIAAWSAADASSSPARGDCDDLNDPGRERRAQRRARALLRSCVGEEDWEMYSQLGFLRVSGRVPAGANEECAYLIYPHAPIVAYAPRTGALLGEYCLVLDAPPARAHARAWRGRRSGGGARLPDADDVLAKWMLLSGDEQQVLAQANLHMPGRQLDPRAVARDLARLAQWERERRRAPTSAGSLRALCPSPRST